MDHSAAPGAALTQLRLLLPLTFTTLSAATVIIATLRKGTQRVREIG